MSEEFMINQKKVISITNEMLRIFEKMKEDTKIFDRSARIFDEMMQSDTSKNAVEAAAEMYSAVTTAEAIIEESVANIREGAEIMDMSEAEGRKIGE